MKKRFLFILLAIVILLMTGACTLESESSTVLLTVFDGANDISIPFKFERLLEDGSTEGYVSWSSQTTAWFYYLPLVKCDNGTQVEADAQWLYKLTFRCAEKHTGNEEIVMEITDSQILVNGTLYEIAYNCYPFNHFLEELQWRYDFAADYAE